MTGHAGLRGGKPGERGALNRSVAVAAVDAEFTSMVPVAEGHGLLSRDVLFGIPRRHGDAPEREPEHADEHRAAQNADPRNHVRAAMKNLWHRFLLWMQSRMGLLFVCFMHERAYFDDRDHRQETYEEVEQGEEQ